MLSFLFQDVLLFQLYFKDHLTSMYRVFEILGEGGLTSWFVASWSRAHRSLICWPITSREIAIAYLSLQATSGRILMMSDGDSTLSSWVLLYGLQGHMLSSKYQWVRVLNNFNAPRGGRGRNVWTDQSWLCGMYVHVGLPWVHFT